MAFLFKSAVGQWCKRHRGDLPNAGRGKRWVLDQEKLSWVDHPNVRPFLFECYSCSFVLASYRMDYLNYFVKEDY